MFLFFLTGIFIEWDEFLKISLAKRLTEKQKDEIIQSFTDGKTIEFLSQNFNCTKLTIIRNLKKNLGDITYKELIKKNKNHNLLVINPNKKNAQVSKEKQVTNNDEYELYPNSSFIELTPLEGEIENSPRKDYSSIPISEVDLPQIVYMVVNKQIELEIKLLKDYPEWQFLSQRELNRKTIEIFFDLKIAKTLCNKEQKVIKVPNTEVLKIVAPILLSRGISRIVSSDRLIAL